MAEETILLKVGIDENQIARSEAAIIAARQEIDKLKESQKALADEGKKNTVEYVRNETAIRENTTAIRENQRVLDANAKLQKGVGGSIRELRANVSRLKDEYINLSEEQRNNAEVGQALQKELLKQTNALKDLEEEIGVTSRNVGNYTASVIEAVDTTGVFAKAQQALATIQTAATAATQAGTIATQSFGKALLATGIGAIVVVLGSLIAYLTQTQEGMDRVAQATSAVGTFVGVILDAFAKLGGQLFNSVIPAFKGLGEVLAGLFTGDFERAAKGFDDLATAAKSVNGINILQVGANAAVAAGQAATLEKEMQNIVRAEKALSLERAQSRQQIEDLKKASDDINRSTQERAELAEKALNLELALEAKAIDLQKQRVNNIQAKNKLTKATDADTNKAIEAEIELANLQQESATLQTELQNKLNGLRKEGADAQVAINQKAAEDRKAADEKALSEREKAEAVSLQKTKDELEARNAAFAEAIKTQAEQTDETIRTSINAVKQQFADGLISPEEFQKQLDQVEALAIETRRAAVEAQLEATRTNASIDAETRLEIERELQAELRAIQDETVSLGVANAQKLIEANKKQSDLEKKQAQDVANAKIQARDAVLNAAISIFGQESAAGKIAASAQALVDTYAAATAALKIPPPFGQIVAAATVAQGLANVAKINSVSVPKFAEGGGIGINGPSHAGGGVDVAVGGQTVANVEGGEGLFVMKKTAFSALKALSGFNQAHGGKSWFSGGRSFLADGGAVARASAPSLDRRALMDTQQGFENAMGQLTIVTKVSDIERVQGETKLVRVQADLR